MMTVVKTGGEVAIELYTFCLTSFRSRSSIFVEFCCKLEENYQTNRASIFLHSNATWRLNRKLVVLHCKFCGETTELRGANKINSAVDYNIEFRGLNKIPRFRDRGKRWGLINK